MTRRRRAQPRRAADECAHGRGECATHPEPDPLGRYHCWVCGCFTADPNQTHTWCRQ